MLTACAGSRTEETIASAPAPVIERQIEVRTVCPSEVTAPIAAKPIVPEGAVIEGNASGMGWLGDELAWASGLADRLSDAREACK
ncbi:hypothetical protein [Novosphingobium clariflavum]|uniref:Uncharacterized protein n=1 Tax=Novosphingobium clariflavum TaxID=2029884 RepID=A0ABV6SAZ6_9SPHN|nr:hypothetical protein [Novosphingobium clariflavum]